jgi:hypothetical protein
MPLLGNILKEKGQPEEGAVRGLSQEIRTLDSEPAEFSACCAIVNIPAKGYLAVLAYIPGGPGLQYSGRIGRVIDHREKHIKQGVELHPDVAAKICPAQGRNLATVEALQNVRIGKCLRIEVSAYDNSAQIS